MIHLKSRFHHCNQLMVHEVRSKERWDLRQQSASLSCKAAVKLNIKYLNDGGVN